MTTAMRNMLHKPLFWLCCQAVILLVILQGRGKFNQLIRSADSPGYVVVSVSSLPEALVAIRTLGYPVILKGIRLLSPSLAALPICQFLIHVLAVLVFYWGLRCVSCSGGLALAVSSSLLFSRAALQFTNHVIPDGVAISFAIMTIGMLLILVGRPYKVWPWLFLTVSLFCTYQLRPAYLFLIPLLPPLGLLLIRLVPRPVRQGSLYSRAGAAFTGVAVLPLLAFCTFRWAMVGEFGLVSFTGHNLVGIAGQFLVEEQIPELSEDVRPLAQAVLEKEKRVIAREQPAYADWSAYDGWKYWESVECRGWKPDRWLAPVSRNNQLDYRIMWLNYNATVWYFFEPTAKELYDHDNMRADSHLCRLSLEILKNRPSLYGKWLWMAFQDGVKRLLAYVVFDPACAAIISLLGFVHIAYLLKRYWPSVQLSPAATESSRSSEYSIVFNLLLVIALSFAFAKLSLVILVEPPGNRYVEAAAVFLPAPLVVALLSRWHDLRSLRGADREQGAEARRSRHDSARVALTIH